MSMSRKRLSQYSKTESRFKWDVLLDVHEDVKDFPLHFYHTNPRDVYCIQVLHLVTVIYGSLLIYNVVRHEYSLYIGTRLSLCIPLVHAILEYVKFQTYHQMAIKKAEKLTTDDYVFLLPIYLLVIGVVHYFTVMFGAEATANIEGTVVFSCFLASLILFPSYYFSGIQSIRILSFQEKPTSLMQVSLRNVALSSIIGAWFGAFVIPLDWNRSWQQWPIPCIIGSLVGFVCGHVLSYVTMIVSDVRNVR